MNFALLFPGQGSQYAGMGKSLCQDFASADLVFEEASDILKMDMKKRCFNDPHELSKTVHAQPAILTVSVAAFRVFMQEVALKPKVAAGHSLGEYSALVCNGTLSFSDALRIVKRRGELMQQAKGVMISVFHNNFRWMEQICDEMLQQGYLISIACYNTNRQTVISGESQAITSITRKLDGWRIKYRFLNVSAAFHSPLMQQAANQLALEFEDYQFCQWSWPVISNVDALPYIKKDEIKGALTLQMTHPVRWLDTMAYIKGLGVEMAVELGPKTVLRHFMNEFDSQMDAVALGTSTDLNKVISVISERDKQTSSGDPSPQQMNLFLAKCYTAAISMPNRNEDDMEYQRSTSEVYRKLKHLQQGMDHSSPTLQHLQQAVDLLCTVWKAKKTPGEVQRERLQSLFQESGMKDLLRSQKITTIE
ncbi:ACP S-malonyltransferase [Melghirimyces algeriensis]|uniref:[acyl-carrier-protein] S-malonyltransferase n=1 Tax=Melghirimyces algeriensis TaxID=910412 RepID=A0A521CVW7_9BACL|nr:ACP S-malonyltransferase [Melghirimyces algeriensis]SMO63573.1 [acyl-carrier-protein] S-malonyltransferase [Melghirimyces algeriensis]